MSVQTTEQKKEEFRKYLEKNGVIDQLTKVLVGLYEEPEKPSNVTDFIKKSLGAPSDTDVDALMNENEELKRQKNELDKKIETLQHELEQERAKNQWMPWNWIHKIVNQHPEEAGVSSVYMQF